MKIVVIGGTGLIGSKVVAKLTEHGHEAVPASPRLGINTITGEGVAAALDGASVVVDVSNSPNFEYATALEFFETSTRNLLAAEAEAGVGHHVALSVVGTKPLSEGGDRETTTAGYFLAKLSQEALIQASSIPYTIVHATQFFEFIKSIADSGTEGGTVRVPPVLFQPMAADDVAKAVGRAAASAPVNGIVEVGGPEQLRFDEVIRRVLAAQNDPREVVADSAAGYFGIAVGERTLVPAGGAMLGEIRLDDWLREAAAAVPAKAAAV
ncbi:MAG: SDR family oxidoreductase [Candidatus Limnocylindria bacterium]